MTTAPSDSLDDYLPPDTPDPHFRDEAQEDILSLDVEGERRKAKDRSFIAKTVVVSFLAISAFLIVYILVSPIFCCWATLKEPAQEAATILGSVLLPVVTLVLGYYFGTASDRS